MARKKPEIRVSDHALLRYLERVGKIDLDAVRRLLLPDHVADRIRALGDGVYPVIGSHRLQVRAGVVVTVLAEDMRFESDFLTPKG